MATADEVLAVASGEVGYSAPSDPEAGSKYARWMADVTGESWLCGPSTEIWWCCCFVSWVLDRAGQACPGFPSYNTDLALRGGPPTVPVVEMRPGDIVIWDWDDNGATDHIGFVESYVGGKLVTIEGNYRNAVARVDRTSSMALVSAVIRPPYDATRAWDVSKGIDIYNGDGAKGMRGDETAAGFVICKASEGTAFRDAYAAGFADNALAAGKLLGFYHFARNGDADAEAEWFVACCKDTGHLGEATLWLDYEASALSNGPAWAERFMRRVDELTGKTCGVYMSQSTTVTQDWAGSAWRPLWVAQYADTEPTGWQDDPWTVGVFGAWGSRCAIHQYTDNGRVPGSGLALDLDKGHFTDEEWARLAGSPSADGADAETPKARGIAVDGYWGPETTMALQRRFGVGETGQVMHQWPTNAQPAFSSGWSYDRTGRGDPLIRAIQGELGVHADGIMGPHTIMAMQRRFGTPVDGELWEASPCIKAMQRALNEGRF